MAMRKSVAACMAAVDTGVGAVMDALQRAAMADNSLVVLSTDNGGPTDGADNNNMVSTRGYLGIMFEHDVGECASQLLPPSPLQNNFPLRGCKGGYFEGGVRAVGLIHGMGLGGGEAPTQKIRLLRSVLPVRYALCVYGVAYKDFVCIRLPCH